MSLLLLNTILNTHKYALFICQGHVHACIRLKKLFHRPSSHRRDGFKLCTYMAIYKYYALYTTRIATIIIIIITVMYSYIHNRVNAYTNHTLYVYVYDTGLANPGDKFDSPWIIIAFTLIYCIAWVRTHVLHVLCVLGVRHG